MCCELWVWNSSKKYCTPKYLCLNFYCRYHLSSNANLKKSWARHKKEKSDTHCVLLKKRLSVDTCGMDAVLSSQYWGHFDRIGMGHLSIQCTPLRCNPNFILQTTVIEFKPKEIFIETDLCWHIRAIDCHERPAVADDPCIPDYLLHGYEDKRKVRDEVVEGRDELHCTI